MSGAIDLPGVAPRQNPSTLPLDDDGPTPTGVVGPIAEGALQTSAAEASGAGAPDHLAGRLRAQYERVLASNVEEFEVPGWNGDLVARVQVIEDRQDFVRTARAKESDAAFIARATVQLLMTDDDGNLVELSDARGPIAFDDRFAAMLGIKAENASDCVIHTLARNPVRVTRFAERLLTWMEQGAAAAEGELLPS